MILNNTWANDEDNCCFQFNVFLILAKEDYLEKLLVFNKKLHAITWKYRLLMTVSPDYCEEKGIDYLDHYNQYLLKKKDTASILPRIGYEFYEKGIDSVSLMFYCGEDNSLISEYVHYLQNGLYGNPVYAKNGKDVDVNDLNKFVYDSSPLLFDNFASAKVDDLNNRVEISFSIESHLTIWKDYVYGFKYLDESGRVEILKCSDNRKIAYRNTPRLNSFLRDLQYLVSEMGGRCELYDFTLADNVTNKAKENNSSRKGLTLDGKIVYQEDIDEGRVKLPSF